MQRTTIYKGVLIVIAFVVVAVIAAVFFLPRLLDQQLGDKIREGVYAGTKKTYVLQFEGLKTSLFPFSIVLLNPSLVPAKTDSSSIAVVITAKNMQMNSINLRAVLFDNYFEIGEATFTEPFIDIYRSYKSETDTQKLESKKEKIDSLLIREIIIADASIAVHNHVGDTVFFKAKRNAFNIKNFRLTVQPDDSNNLFFADSITAKLHDVELKLDPNYKARIETVYMSFTDSFLRMDSLSIRPLLGKKEFAKRMKYQIDRFDIFLLSIQFVNADLPLLLKSNKLIADSASVSKGKIEAYRDKNYVRKVEVIPSLQEKLQKLPLIVKIKKVSVTGLDVSYQEVAEGMDRPGVILMNGMKSDITNVVAGVKSKDTLTIISSASTAGNGTVKVNWHFPLNSPKTLFTVDGSVINLPLTSLNGMVQPNAHVEIKSGYIDKMDFTIKADHNYARGEVMMWYHDLNISIEANGKNKTITNAASLAVNELLIYDSNPSKNDGFRKGIIAYPNNPQRFIFNYSWKALLTGITDVTLIKRKWR